MEEYESLRSFLEHVALVMDAEQNAELDAVSIMTLHSAKGLEFATVFLPGWEEGLFPHQRALDEGGRSGLEEERRLAYVGLTRAKKNLPHLVRLQPPHPRPVAIHHPVALPRRIARGACRGRRGRQVLWRLWAGWPAAAARDGPPLWRLALRQCRGLLQHLRHAGLAARTGKPHRGDRPQLGHALRPPGRAHRLWRKRRSVKTRTIEGELVAKSTPPRPHHSRSATGSFTSNSAMAMSPVSRATS